MTGPSAADRRTAAYALAQRLLAERRRVEVLDRAGGHDTDVERIGLMAEVLARNGVVAIVPCAEAGVPAVRIRHDTSRTRYVEVCAFERDLAADAVQGLLAGRG
ncbi:hypothetical protein [Streptomyces sp. P17]|uniref:hypothetical protein n=1 Tax=Streptomyces sp. P17 TaxID=3074716 RepID=UPI0028F3F861|nr:hypothetical protein [Streptomyces sp. P17]MDT9695327.1 hypothetical protein [Streptomyces sp. P17]